MRTYRNLLQEERKMFDKLNEDYRNSLQDKGAKLEVNKNIFQFPINSAALNLNNSDLKENRSAIQYYESNFVYSIVTNIIMKAIS